MILWEEWKWVKGRVICQVNYKNRRPLEYDDEWSFIMLKRIITFKEWSSLTKTTPTTNYMQGRVEVPLYKQESKRGQCDLFSRARVAPNGNAATHSERDVATRQPGSRKQVIDLNCYPLTYLANSQFRFYYIPDAGFARQLASTTHRFIKYLRKEQHPLWKIK